MDHSKVTVVLERLKGLLAGANKDKNNIFLREKKGVITLMKLLRNLADAQKVKTRT